MWTCGSSQARIAWRRVSIACSRGNPLKILKTTTDAKTGELAMYATRVKVAKTNKRERIVRMGQSDTQYGRRLARTVSVDALKRTKGA